MNYYDERDTKSERAKRAAVLFAKGGALAFVVGFLLYPHENLRADLAVALIVAGVIAAVVALLVAFFRAVEYL